MTGLELMNALSAMSYSTLSREVTTLIGDVWTPVEGIDESLDEDGDLWPVIQLGSAADEEGTPAVEQIDDSAPESLVVRNVLHRFHVEILVNSDRVKVLDPAGELLQRGWISEHDGNGGNYSLTAAGQAEFQRTRYMPYGSA